MNTLNIHFITKEKSYTPQFSGVDPKAFYADAVQAGRRAGIFKGDGTLNPLGHPTRAEAAVIMARILGIVPNVE